MNSSGYVLNSKTGTCDDINECVETPDACGAYGQCINENGTFSCQCHAGYSLSIPGRSLVALTGQVMKSVRTSEGGRSPVGISDDRTWQIFALNQEKSRFSTFIALERKILELNRVILDRELVNAAINLNVLMIMNVSKATIIAWTKKKAESV